MICSLFGHKLDLSVVNEPKIENVPWSASTDAHSILTASTICMRCGVFFYYKEKLPVLLHKLARDKGFSVFLDKLGIK